METIFCGNPGGGKTLHAVYEILRTNRKTVVTNVPLNQSAKEHLAKRGVELVLIEEKESILKFYEPIRNNTLYVIDEAFRYWNQRDHSAKHTLEMLDWLVTHRHHDCDIIFVVQSVKLLAMGARELAEYYVWHTDMRKRTILIGSRGPSVICATYYCDVSMSEGALDRREWIRIHPNNYRHYRTSTISGEPEARKEVGSPFWVLIVVGVVGLTAIVTAAVKAPALMQYIGGKFLAAAKPVVNKVEQQATFHVGDVEAAKPKIVLAKKTNHPPEKIQRTNAINVEEMVGYYVTGEGKVIVADPDFREARKTKVENNTLYYLDTQNRWQKWR